MAQAEFEAAHGLVEFAAVGGVFHHAREYQPAHAMALHAQTSGDVDRDRAAAHLVDDDHGTRHADHADQGQRQHGHGQREQNGARIKAASEFGEERHAPIVPFRGDIWEYHLGATRRLILSVCLHKLLK